MSGGDGWMVTGSFQYLNPYLSPCGFPPNIVTKVKQIKLTIKITFPRAIQNSLSPYHFTAVRFTSLKQSISYEQGGDITHNDLRIACDNYSNHNGYMNLIGPVM